MSTLTASVNGLLKNGDAWAWIGAISLAFVLTIIAKIALRTVGKRLQLVAARYGAHWSNLVAASVNGTKRWILFIWFFYPFFRALNPSEGTLKLVQIVTVIASVLQIGIWGFQAIRSWRENYLVKKIGENPSSAAALGLLYAFFQVMFVCTLVLIGLSNLGIDIAALLAGLGVGGIAVALAAQNILGDLLASLSIVLDKPFVIGDFIVIGSEMGTVEHIGIKTTRVRSLSGEELVFSNKDLLESRVRNFKRMWERRVVQKFGVVYGTSPATIERIPTWVEEFVKKHSKLRFDRCHFSGYGNSSLDFELVFWVSDPEYNVFMDLQQSVLLDILRKFNAEKVEFAFPTQTLYIQPPTPSDHSNPGQYSMS